MNDKQRLDWLERMAVKPGGILLHGEKHPTGRLGLGLMYPERMLREAIDAAARSSGDYIKKTKGKPPASSQGENRD